MDGSQAPDNSLSHRHAAKSDKRLGILRILETYGNIYPLSRIERA